jgi:hypothetical protein
MTLDMFVDQFVSSSKTAREMRRCARLRVRALRSKYIPTLQRLWTRSALPTKPLPVWLMCASLFFRHILRTKQRDIPDMSVDVAYSVLRKRVTSSVYMCASAVLLLQNDPVWFNVCRVCAVF